MSATPSIFILLLFFFTLNSIAAQSNSTNCASSFCGNIRISYPYRLNSSPKSCGYDEPSFELECLQNNQTIFNSKSGKYIVQDINYDYYSIRLVDPSINRANLSSCPLRSSSGEDYPAILGISFVMDWNIPVSFIHCRNSTSNSKFVEGPFCGNRSSILSNSSQIHAYVMAKDVATVSELEASSCEVDRMVWTSGRRGVTSDYSSLAGIYDDLAYGVELTWFRVLCGSCDRTRGFCSLDGKRIKCTHYCYEDTPYSERSFKCKMEYWGIIGIVMYIGIALGALVALRFLIGLACLVGLMVSQWRKRRLPV